MTNVDGARRTRWLGGLTLGIVAAGCGDSGQTPAGARSLDPFPPPVEARPASQVVPEDFAGAESCAECHQEEYAAWAGSTHGRAGGDPRPDILIAPFDGSAIRFADGEVVPRRNAKGGYEFLVRQDGFDDQVFSVDGVVGGGHMLGGGTQGFFTNQEDGTVRFLAFDWSRQEGEWFCNTGTRLNQGWVPVTPEMRLADCGDWPPVRVLGTEARFSNCQECHGSQIRLSLDPDQGRYRTTYTTLGVNCESCHGPALEHVERSRAEDFGPDGTEMGLASLTVMDKDASLEVCFRCHALKDVLAEDFLPGDSLELFYALKFPVLGDEPFFADARVRTFAYQGTHLASACYLDGSMDCVSCHEPHGQGYWDQHRNPLSNPFDDGQCTSCHAAKAQDPESHTFHSPESEGSRCVNCHMPYLQHPEVGPGVRFARSDHTIPVPRPGFDEALGVESACAQCHEDRPAEVLREDAARWWGELKPHRPLVTGQMEAPSAAGRVRAAELLLLPGQNDPLLQFQALAQFVVERLKPDLPGLEEPVRDRLLDLSLSPDLDVRALSLAALHWSRGDDRAVRSALVEALEREPGWALRGRWVLALGFLGDSRAEEGDFEAAELAYAKALQVSPDDPRVLAARGLARYQGGDFAGAVASLRRSAELDPRAPLTRVTLGMALAASGNGIEAQQVYTELIQENPSEPLAWLNLGNLLQRGERLDEAVEAYRRALALDPSLARGHFYLARSLALLGRIPEALPPARRAVELEPEYQPAQDMLRDLMRAAGATP